MPTSTANRFLAGIGVFALLVGPASAQRSDPPAPVLSRDAISSALTASNPAIGEQAPAAWLRLRQFLEEDVVVHSEGEPHGVAGKLMALDADSLTVAVRAGRDTQARVVPREAIGSVQHLAGRRGSILGAVLGGAAGLGLGALIAVKAANSECFGSCTGNVILGGAAVIGLPIGGGVLGYRSFGSGRRTTLIYVKP